ncbi:N-acetyltransferase family protein [Sphingomonas sp.]|uniref:GNAT family N-acetyltransferase n=1 Tax=Sphingomonas sp. TaxID=28214 RepID=UPI003D6D01E9
MPIGKDPAIRRYDPADWEAISRVHDTARLIELDLTVGVGAFRSLADTAGPEGLFDGDVWIAEHDAAVRGFIAFTASEINWLYVDPGHARLGIGRTLLRHALLTQIESAQADTIEVSVLDGNTPAMALYLSEGFRLLETRDGHLDGAPDTPARGHILALHRE